MYIMDLLDKSDTTNSDELNTLCSKLLGDSFKGVYSADNIPKLLNHGDCLIFNNQNSNQNGEHWLGLYNECGKEYAYDTFARDIKELNKHFKHKKWIIPKHRRTESIHGEDCGQQVVAFLCTVRKYSIQDFFDTFR
ncbi:MAG TPA: hypothetical protein V6C58_21015 [Allocoleopsis sp.]